MRLKEKYQKQVIPAMKKEFALSNDLAVPKIEKVVVNMGIGRLVVSGDKEAVKQAEKIITLITGQKPVVKKAKKSISAFKLRQGMPVGIMVTLRGQRMYDFLERLVFIALPRMRDFRGIKLTAIDKQGNLSLGIKEHVVFPAAENVSNNRLFGLEITIVNNAKTRDRALKLFELLGFPLAKVE